MVYDVEGGVRLSTLCAHERPQERLARCGATALSDVELLAMLLRSGSRQLDVMGVAATLLKHAGSLSGLLRMNADDFRAMHGLGEVKSLQLVAVTELARRILARRDVDDVPHVETAEDAFSYPSPMAAGLEAEKFWVLCLNRRNRILRCAEVTSGTATQSLVHAREVFREAIRNGATAIVAAHNHPSGDPSPSRADVTVTQQLAQASAVLGIQLLDHIIVGTPERDPLGRGFHSFAEAGAIPAPFTVTG